MSKDYLLSTEEDTGLVHCLTGALAVATQQDRLAAPARLIVRVWSHWPVATGFVVTVGSAWLIWRAGPHTGVLKSMTGLLRSLLHG